MKFKTLIGAAAASVLLAGSAHAERIAGWDFSQYAVDGSLAIDFTFANVGSLDANYSDFDPTDGAGVESAAYGTLYYDGTFGSSVVDLNVLGVPALFGTDSNGPPVTSNDFSNPNILTQEGGQDFNSTTIGLGTQSALDIVFHGTLVPMGGAGSVWELSLGGRVFPGAANTSVGVAFSTDGVNYADLGSILLTGVDTAFTVAADAGIVSEQGMFRLSFAGDSGAVIDNVELNAIPGVPEPTALVLIGLALGGIASARRRA